MSDKPIEQIVHNNYEEATKQFMLGHGLRYGIHYENYCRYKCTKKGIFRLDGCLPYGMGRMWLDIDEKSHLIPGFNEAEEIELKEGK